MFFGKGPWIMMKQCVFGEDPSEMQVKYLKQFWKLYQRKRKFYSLRMQASHTIGAQNSRYADESIVKYLEWMRD